MNLEARLNFLRHAELALEDLELEPRGFEVAFGRLGLASNAIERQLQVPHLMPEILEVSLRFGVTHLSQAGVDHREREQRDARDRET